jgi:hypothetical protein
MPEATRAALWEKLRDTLDARGVRCSACRALARSWTDTTNIIEIPDWQWAIRATPEAIDLAGILLDYAVPFLHVFERTAFGYYADAEGQCPECGRGWHYRANLHECFYDGCLTLRLLAAERSTRSR